MARREPQFQAIRSEGGLLPPDLLRRALDPRSGLSGMKPDDYTLAPGERLNEIITQSWNRLRKHWAEFRSAAGHLPEGEAGTGLTNDKWSLPLLRELGFGLLPASAGPEIGGRAYATNSYSCSPTLLPDWQPFCWALSTRSSLTLSFVRRSAVSTYRSSR